MCIFDFEIRWSFLRVIIPVIMCDMLHRHFNNSLFSVYFISNDRDRDLI
jgi:hypothetical protein